MTYKTYRLWRYPVYGVYAHGNIDGRYLTPEPKPTQITFRARNEKEAMKKANSFWREGEFGMGSIFVRRVEVK